MYCETGAKWQQQEQRYQQEARTDEQLGMSGEVVCSIGLN